METSGNGLNTLEYAERLMRAGVPEEQAKAQALVLYEIINSSLATKRDITELKRDMKELETANKRDLKELDMKLTIRLGALYASSLGALLAMAKLGWLSIQ